MTTAGWPRTLLVAAAIIGLVHGACVALGLGAHVAILCGMGGGGTDTTLGLVHVLSYFALVLVAPICALAGAAGVLGRRLTRLLRARRADASSRSIGGGDTDEG